MALSKKGREETVKVIRKVWDSLDSHLDLAVTDPKRKCPHCGGKRFHAECAFEYAENIMSLARLLLDR